MPRIIVYTREYKQKMMDSLIIIYYKLSDNCDTDKLFNII